MQCTLLADGIFREQKKTPLVTITTTTTTATPSTPALATTMRPPSQVLRALAEAQARIFSTTPPPAEGTPVGLRTGAKFLRKRLVGPSMLNYYPPSLNLRPLGKLLYGEGAPLEGLSWKAPDGSLRQDVVSPKELQRLTDVARKRQLGKGPPKKGTCSRRRGKGEGVGDERSAAG